MNKSDNILMMFRNNGSTNNKRKRKFNPNIRFSKQKS